MSSTLIRSFISSRIIRIIAIHCQSLYCFAHYYDSDYCCYQDRYSVIIEIIGISIHTITDITVISSTIVATCMSSFNFRETVSGVGNLQESACGGPFVPVPWILPPLNNS